MKKIFSLCLLSLFLLSLMASFGFSQKAADILEKMIEAKGGRKVLESIKDTTMSCWIDTTHPFLKQEISPPGIPMKFYHKEPDKFRQDIGEMGKGSFIVLGYDGETSWKFDPLTRISNEPPEEQEWAMIKAFNLGNSALLHPEKYGITYTYKGKEDFKGWDFLEGLDCFVLEQTFSNGNKAYLYVDSKTHLIHTIKDTMGRIWGRGIIFWNYKKVGGVMFANSITFKYDQWSTMTVKEVIFNTGLEDSLFKRSK